MIIFDIYMKKKILIAPLNWGIGHATRCIPIINWLIDYNFEPIIASDGDALHLLKKEFPELKHETLPSYDIEYTKKGANLKWKLLAQTPKVIKAKKAEKKATATLVEKHKLSGIISDNRFGVRHNSIPSVFITHQLNVLSGNTSQLSSKLHQSLMTKFNAIWVPDFKNEPSLSGKLGHTNEIDSSKITYLGPLSRLSKAECEIKYDIMVLISGPEPQRSLLIEKLFKELKHYNGNIIFIKGIIEPEQTCETFGQFTVYNFMTSKALEKTINSSNLIICRSGYTTVMDLTKLGKKAFFIPTPGQFEQEYLANYFETLKLAPTCSQEEFTVDKLKSIDNYSGLNMVYNNPNLDCLFSLF